MIIIILQNFVEFFKEQKNIKNINCYSNDGGNWKKSNLKFENKFLIINFEKNLFQEEEE